MEIRYLDTSPLAGSAPAVAAPEHPAGYNALLVDIPGQRSACYSDPDLIFRPDTDVQLRYVVDYALSRPDVRPEHLSLTGYSMGGLFAPRAAAGEKRIKAVVDSTLAPSFVPGIMSLLGVDPSEPCANRTDLDSLAGQAPPMARLLLGDVRERFGCWTARYGTTSTTSRRRTAAAPVKR